MEFDFRYEELYEMTIRELVDSLIARRKGLSYSIWKQAYLIAWATMGKHYPRTPDKASPELAEKKKTIPMPINLLKKNLNNIRGGKIDYE